MSAAAENGTGAQDLVWSAQDTTPGEVDSALRQMLGELHARDSAYVPGRVLNLVSVVDREWSGEVANRMRRVGRFHPSRTIVCAVEPGRTTLDARATIAVPGPSRGGAPAVARELIVLTCGARHLEHLDRLVDPLVVTDLATVVWSPHGHPEAVRSVLPLAQVVLLDSVDAATPADAIARARELSQDVYVVDLAWLRTTPWRERIAATFDPPWGRAELATLDRVVVRHHPESTMAGLLFVGWLASRLGWEPSGLVASGKGLEGRAHARRQDVAIRLEVDPTMQVRGLAGVELGSAGGRTLSYDRGPGGLRARYAHRRGTEREWTIMGASRGEAGILGEGIRQALLRDPTYRPALDAAAALVG
ncbi:glucose-6-phosphate dehydrogenase assembly protein OpcA [Conexibacter sp. SYSU D00693]|uniref:glucose-6-phosphate dehydrogenase assembly protein OpcA n=1 Tax=Conexibacter sp. SYSU D00693 TaxID=2812560 RepID=UPI00196B402F|nr:glucose-6-phosphate dehydrogenase assembly protein OpcA [Conexibacter sp. SYSU D00693]